MFKLAYVFILFLKINKNNSYLFFKNYSQFYFVFLKKFQ